MGSADATRRLTITVDADWRGALRDAASAAFAADTYLGETLNFETPAAFFSRLTGRRWALLQVLQREGTLTIDALARRAGQALETVGEDVAVLLDLGLIEETAGGHLICPFADIHVDMHLREAV
ncbi:MAG: transcriptional regulator [Thiohalocapsa sp.]|jgi:predicted transcriptional regulator|uniref:HVO_A0114 family putative DNA-binding protein n=1 Tax=Thiohalocapsa sp. TaxID=2497641 RepID=UPI0025EFB26C|nr:transcriptional regulator [Thiohalocapsa sp.]MCG6943347.1 transcriptional regulator [Thiohalocapsa sp.]